ncbi:Alpha/Beta hydrolase protein [Aspergillus unguis]
MIKSPLLRHWRYTLQTRTLNIPKRQIHNLNHLPRKTTLPTHNPLLNNLKKRTLFTESLPPVLIPPVLFVGLLLGLWTWKCLWIILLQDKLLYLAWLPPLSRSEKIEDYAREFRGVSWTKKQIRSLDGTKLAVCEGRPPLPRGNALGAVEPGKMKKRVVICYFQGNGGSTPLRLPLLSQVMKSITDSAAGGEADAQTEYILVALSYRGYWTSSGRATQSGIQKDAQAFLSWVYQTYGTSDKDLRVVLWGHSLGAAVASAAVARQLQSQPALPVSGGLDRLSISGLVLEAPISSIKDMLISLYPQRWLPYRYLWPFSWNTWDVSRSLQDIASTSQKDKKTKRMNAPPILLMSADSDEVIPLWVADHLEDKAQGLGLDIQRVNVKGAMHIEGPLKFDGRKALVDFIRDTSR